MENRPTSQAAGMLWGSYLQRVGLGQVRLPMGDRALT